MCGDQKQQLKKNKQSKTKNTEGVNNQRVLNFFFNLNIKKRIKRTDNKY